MKNILLLLLLIISTQTFAQLFGKKDISIQQGIMSFHPEILNNGNNSNTRLSWISEIDRNFMITRMSSFNYGIGLGDLRNPDTLFKPYEHSKFLRVKFGLVLHLPQFHTARNWSPKRINPYIKVGYNMDISDYNYGEKYSTRLNSSLKLGVGMVYRISHSLGLQFESSHNQRVSSDYRSFFQHNFGLIINLDLPYQEY